MNFWFWIAQMYSRYYHYPVPLRVLSLNDWQSISKVWGLSEKVPTPGTSQTLANSFYWGTFWTDPLASDYTDSPCIVHNTYNHSPNQWKCYDPVAESELKYDMLE